MPIQMEVADVFFFLPDFLILNHSCQDDPHLLSCPPQAKAAALLETSSSSSDAAVSDFSYLKKTDRQEQCSASLSINRAILKIFSDPGVVQQAEKDLDAHANHSLKETLKNIHEAEKEEIHAVGRFLKNVSTRRKRREGC